MEKLWRVVGWRRLLVTGLCLTAWRALEQIPVSGLSHGVISLRLQAADTSSLIHTIGSGIVLSAYSIVAIGITPYINALIVMWALQLISGRLRAIGSTADGKVRLLRWTRALTIAFVLGQGYGWTVLMQSDSILPPMDWFSRLVICLELTGGTLILVWIADLLDEFGLGFGNGAILIYALTPLAVEAHRLVQFFATAPSVEALYLPFLIWVAFSIGVVALTVAVLSAVRRVPPAEDTQPKRPVSIELPVLISGVLRPPMFVQALLFLPVIVSNYYAVSNPGLIRWITDYSTPYGPNPWADAVYVAIESCLVLGFTYFVVGGDLRLRPSVPPVLIPHINRLTFICGTFLAFTVVVLPVVEWNATHAVGRGFFMSGLDVVLIAVMILAIVGTLERAAKLHTPLRPQMSYLP